MSGSKAKNVDPETGEVTERETETKSKMVIKDLGNPKLVDEKNPRVILGTIFGRVTGTKVTEIRGETFIGLTGAFEGVPENPEWPIVQSGVCYLPGGFQEPILEAMGPDGKGVVEFAYECAAVHANNPIGYSYAFKPLLKRTGATDPLAAMKAEVDAGRKKLPAPAKAA